MLPFSSDFLASMWLLCNAEGPCSIRILSPSGCVLAFSLWISGDSFLLLPAFLVDEMGPQLDADLSSYPYLPTETPGGIQ